MKKLVLNFLQFTEKNPLEVLIYLFVFLLPLQTRYFLKESFLGGEFWEYGSFSLYGLDILFLLICCCFFLKEKQRFFEEFKKNKILTYTVYFIFSLPAVCFISSFFAISPSISVYVGLRLLMAALLTMIIMLSQIQVKSLMIFLLFSAVLQAFLGTQQFLLQDDILGSNKWLGVSAHDPSVLGVSVVDTGFRRWLRAYGTLPHPNILGGFLVLGIFIAISWWQSVLGRFKNATKINEIKQLKIERLGAVLSFILLVTGLFFTFSRSAMLGLILGGVCLLFFILFRKGKFIFSKNFLYPFFSFVVIAGILIASLSSIFWPLVKTRYFAEGRLEEKSLTERAQYIEEAKMLFNENFPLGVGGGNYTLGVWNLFPDFPAWFYQPIHNVFILLSVELGVLGILWIFLFMYFVFFELKYIYNQKRENFWQLIVFSCFVAYLGISFFDHYLWTQPIGIWISALLLGLYLKMKFKF